MKRLTTKYNGGYLFNMPPKNNENDLSAHMEYLGKVSAKLGEYEDLEEQEMLIRLPCKVGDVVWHEKEYATYLIGVHPYQITNVMISQNKKGEWTKKYRAMLIRNGNTIDCQVNFSFDDIGKTVFLNREQAEKKINE